MSYFTVAPILTSSIYHRGGRVLNTSRKSASAAFTRTHILLYCNTLRTFGGPGITVIISDGCTSCDGRPSIVVGTAVGISPVLSPPLIAPSSAWPRGHYNVTAASASAVAYKTNYTRAHLLRFTVDKSIHTPPPPPPSGPRIIVVYVVSFYFVFAV